MYIKITSPDQVIYNWEVKKAILPTEEGEITVLKNHIPLVSTIKPGIAKIVPVEHDEAFVKSADFLFEDEKINISLSKWLIFTEWNQIVITTAEATTSPQESLENLEEMKNNLEEKLNQLRKKWSMEEIEETVISLDKINADIKLKKLWKN